ncbi:N-formylglutamate amidohydrolase [Sphingopyxis sp. YR583]|jgi:N-formylglutamate amidohydrolase|uniref:N-formylglutamate amidohydrolase n=1 Tax=Sphingopyxis sp. YR583 TaxID=1881047 RepID=UPI0008A7FDD4|nr:N-formylglutamate amidohydrolase [Sphingopyxis sp. YR583]SEH18324.1 N-formylglutamate amidohydrolase [Sphingopyxis sp. YR583]
MSLRSIPSAAFAVNRPAVSGPVIVSVPHAGRIYPPDILDAARVEQGQLERLEDAWSDLIAAEATGAGATVVQALWARAVADLNRGEGQMAPGEVAMPLRAQFSVPGRKERAGLGVVPTRLADCGPLWKRPIDGAGLHWRLESFHRPYHAALAEALKSARNRFGYSILIDLHSMPSIPVTQPGCGARIVIGDRFGETAGTWLIDRVMMSARCLGEVVTRNQPYAGGHIIRTHGRPGDGVHAVQIEIDRCLYLMPDRSPDSARVARLARWFAELVKDLGQMRPDTEIFPQAAE